jgi:hypothetical protein
MTRIVRVRQLVDLIGSQLDTVGSWLDVRLATRSTRSTAGDERTPGDVDPLPSEGLLLGASCALRSGLVRG